MGDFLLAYFHTQLEAVASAKKLVAYGVRRDRVSVHLQGDLSAEHGSANSASFSDSELPQGDLPGSSSGLISNEPLEKQLFNGSSTLAVTLKDHASINDVCLVLKDAGAYLIDVTEHNAVQEYPDM
jgi:hypothetical protein